MGSNLRDRLKRIKQAQVEAQEAAQVAAQEAAQTAEHEPAGADSCALPSEWVSAGYKTVMRKVRAAGGAASFFERPSVFPPALAILVPDLLHYRLPVQDSRVNNQQIIDKQNIVFFDLETTGLGGAGTVAFLAAFGRFNGNVLEITQYLLLDFPGEIDFLEAVLKEFADGSSHSAPQLFVTYNGKAFDSQIIKTRCHLNGFSPPDYLHADLLHPCRRLWKGVLPDCSQAVIETGVLGFDRTGDIPGSRAPDIWFSFLKNGCTDELIGICDHNVKDIQGLAGIFFALGEIAASPLECRVKWNFSLESIALRWRDALCRQPDFFSEAEAVMAKALIRAAAEESHPRVLKVLAMEAEWKSRDFTEALKLTEKILAVKDISSGFMEETLRRRQRLLGKLK